VTQDTDGKQRFSRGAPVLLSGPRHEQRHPLRRSILSRSSLSLSLRDARKSGCRQHTTHALQRLIISTSLIYGIANRLTFRIVYDVQKVRNQHQYASARRQPRPAGKIKRQEKRQTPRCDHRVHIHETGGREHGDNERHCDYHGVRVARHPCTLRRRARGEVLARNAGTSNATRSSAGQRLRRVTAAQRPRAAAAAAPPHRPPARLRRGRAQLLPGAACEPASPPLRVPTRSAAATVDRDLLLPRWRAATRRPRFAHLLVQRRLLRDSPRGTPRWKSKAEGPASQEQICQLAEAAGGPVLMWRAHLSTPWLFSHRCTSAAWPSVSRRGAPSSASVSSLPTTRSSGSATTSTGCTGST